MTLTQQRGYDDQAAGMLNPALAEADTAEGRAYRDGVRARRRDEEEGVTPEQRAEMNARGDAPEAPRDPEPAEAPAAPPPSKLGAFSDPEPEEKPRKRRPAAADDGQGILFG